MAQLTLYMDEKTRNQIAKAARAAGVSVSRWVTERLGAALAKEWPVDYFKLFGSLGSTDLKRAPQPRLEDDVPRERP